MFLALAKNVPAGDGKTTANPYKTWKDVNPALPNLKIEVMGPPPTSGTRDAFVELAMEGGCKSFKWIKAFKKKDKKAYKALCHTIREDGAFIEMNLLSHCEAIYGMCPERSSFSVFPTLINKRPKLYRVEDE